MCIYVCVCVCIHMYMYTYKFDPSIVYNAYPVKIKHIS